MFLIQVLFVLFLNTLVTSQNLEVTTPSGKILGSTLRTRLGKTIFSFRGIRYAEPPVGELRFKPPVPIEKWSGTYNATADGPICPQPTTDPVSEDCLFLNVYTTKLPAGGKNPKRPVIIYLHPGAFFFFAGRSNWAGPQYFLDQDIVFVTLNYRITTLGFLSVGKEVPGNNGLKDQVVAMKWVKKNIAVFGGDPDSVTLYGYSAGAWSISLHLVSPMSRGLFHKGILGSGSALGPWPLHKNQIEVARKQARILNCSDSTPKEIVDCLKTKPEEDFLSLEPFSGWGGSIPFTWSPVIEEDYGQERFLTDHPIKLIESGNFQKIPIVAGVTRDEFDYGFLSVINNETLLNDLNDNFERIAPIIFNYEKDTEKSREISRTIRKYYLGDAPLTKASFSGLVKMSNDAVVGFPVNRAVDLIADKSHKPVYYYQFTYPGRYSFYYYPNTTKPYGVVHHDDLIYLLYMGTFPFFDQSYPESEMVTTLTSLWANFAKTGKPFVHIHSNKCAWETYNTKTKKYMEIGKKLVLKNNMHEERYALWRKLLPISYYL